MNREFFKALIATSVFENLPETTRALLNRIMLTSATTMETEAMTTKETVLEIVMDVEEAAPEVVEVLVEVLKSQRTSRPKSTPTKESAKDKKGKKPAILMHASPRRNPMKDKPTTQEKGEAINLEPEEEETKAILMDDEDVGIDVKEFEVQGADPITWFPEYVPLCKGKTKVPKDID